MEDREDFDSFLGKWRARWPEWRVAEVFVPAELRDAVLAWMSLRQELADAAWAGTDPRPGEAKLGWWSEELLGWTRGARRHPLARALQPCAAPWAALAAALPALAEARERAATFDEARAQLLPYARAVAAVSRTLAGDGTGDGDAVVESIAKTLLAQRLLDGDPASVPLQARASLGAQAGDAELRAAAAAMLLRDWPGTDGLPRAERIQQALVRARMKALAAGGDPARPLQAWRALTIAWRAARR